MHEDLLKHRGLILGIIKRSWECGYEAACSDMEGRLEDFYRRQKKIILRNCGSIDPMAAQQAIARGSYHGAFHALPIGGVRDEQVAVHDRQE